MVTIGNQISIYRYSIDDGVLYSARIEGATEPTGFITPVRKDCKNCNNLFMVGIGHDIVLIEWDGKSKTAKQIRKLSSVETFDPLSRTDIARPDRGGRLYGGTFASNFCISPNNKTFYRYSNSRGLQNLFGNIYTTSGIAFNEHAEKIYHVDVCSLQIAEFDWDPLTGDICELL